MCNLNVLKFFALTRTCMHTKVGLNRKSLGKIENLISTCGLLFLFDGIYSPSSSPHPPPPPPPHTPVPSPSLNAISLQSPAGVLLHFFFTFKEDHVSLFLVKMFLKPVHTRLNKRPPAFVSSFFPFLIVCGHIHIRGPPKSFGKLGRKAIYFQTAIIFRELGNKS